MIVRHFEILIGHFSKTDEAVNQQHFRKKGDILDEQVLAALKIIQRQGAQLSNQELICHIDPGKGCVFRWELITLSCNNSCGCGPGQCAGEGGLRMSVADSYENVVEGCAKPKEAVEALKK